MLTAYYCDWPISLEKIWHFAVEKDRYLFGKRNIFLKRPISSRLMPLFRLIWLFIQLEQTSGTGVESTAFHTVGHKIYVWVFRTLISTNLLIFMLIIFSIIHGLTKLNLTILYILKLRRCHIHGLTKLNLTILYILKLRRCHNCTWNWHWSPWGCWFAVLTCSSNVSSIVCQKVSQAAVGILLQLLPQVPFKIGKLAEMGHSSYYCVSVLQANPL